MKRNDPRDERGYLITTTLERELARRVDNALSLIWEARYKEVKVGRNWLIRLENVLRGKDMRDYDALIRRLYEKEIIDG